MRASLIVLAAGLALDGCSGPGAGRSPSADRSPAAGAAPTKSPVKPGTPADSALPAVRLDVRVQGKVVSVNPNLRFVVMDFPIRRMPALEQRLNVYRQGQKVGEVKVTGPALDTTIAGDIVAGEAQPGDELAED